MNLESPTPDVRRTRAALVLLLLGLLFVMWAMGSLAYRTAQVSPIDSTPHTAASAARSPNIDAAKMLSMVLFVGLVLVLIVLFGSYAIIRAGRRYRAALSAQRVRSPTDDVWSTHKTPTFDDDDETDATPPLAGPAN